MRRHCRLPCLSRLQSVSCHPQTRYTRVSHLGAIYALWPQDIRDVFRMFDSDGSGELDAAEFIEVLGLAGAHSLVMQIVSCRADLLEVLVSTVSEG